MARRRAPRQRVQRDGERLPPIPRARPRGRGSFPLQIAEDHVALADCGARGQQPFGEPGRLTHFSSRTIPVRSTRRISACRDAFSAPTARRGDREIAPRAAAALGQRLADARAQAAFRFEPLQRGVERAARDLAPGLGARSARESGPRRPRPRAGAPPAGRSARARRDRCQAYACIVGYIRRARPAGSGSRIAHSGTRYPAVPLLAAPSSRPPGPRP